MSAKNTHDRARRVNGQIIFLYLLYYFISSFLVLAEEDPALQLITTKSYMKDDINRITEYYKKHKNGTNNQVK